ncbi:MAG: hypothetical protein K6T71_06670 [Candidatus Bipolaricaulota bacterium]|nr:hypothetical protein [Candidatus Bipolaricaulota bacterium]
MNTVLKVLAAIVLVAAPALAQEPLVVKISCREGGALALEPAQIDSLILRATGRTVQWELETANCPPTVSRVEIRFARTSPFGETPADKELIVPELPSPLPESVPLISREITVAGEHRYEVLLLDAGGNVLSKSQGRISARAIAPGMTLPNLLLAGLVVGVFLWVIRRRLATLSASR